ncbi:hypothetical protein KQ939_13390 [Planococcus sp. CP5-4]|uniref:hypothetical protein n=1 Tax=unclassified Planococcus (in: firmicutes) TaxID=2662419 RepID=UPI001C22019B|nr:MULTISPECIES: hypothetical protein [unclassified Planococcus (in: firmicutes)]MBU9674483.1 hypothetical protein [Planococcus sp. CP5-4_YE]MBV0910114.1 hypothetical protein [Planococcus sp. CP5-4_UN]MBW6064679.1 hypothetical protein [Planococcus sp. CP5-4]
MHKPLIALMATALAACSGEQADAGNEAATETEQSFTAIQDASAENSKLQDLKSLPEFTVIDKEIGSDSLEAELVSDNSGERVLLLNKDGDEFKSIFVKETKRLKIIDIDGKGLIFNDILDVR